MSRVLVDTSVLVRYFVGDDPPRSLAAARLVDSRVTLVITTGNLIELVHALRTSHGITNPDLAASLVRFLTRSNVELVDASRDDVIAALLWSMAVSARRIADAIISAAAEAARVDYIATFDEKMASPTVPVRML